MEWSSGRAGFYTWNGLVVGLDCTRGMACSDTITDRAGL